MHIAIEGLDGVGKTSTAKTLANKLEFEFVEKPLHYFFDEEGVNNYLRATYKINDEMDSTFAGLFYGSGNYYTSIMAKERNIITDRHLASTYYWNSTKEINYCSISL